MSLQVCYTAEGFLQKNNNSLHADLEIVLQSAQQPLLAEVSTQRFTPRHPVAPDHVTCKCYIYWLTLARLPCSLVAAWPYLPCSPSTPPSLLFRSAGGRRRRRRQRRSHGAQPSRRTSSRVKAGSSGQLSRTQ